LLVFCTAFRSYAIDAFELRPYGFLVKPFGISEVNLLVHKLAGEVEKRKGATVNTLPKDGKGKFSFKTSHGYVFFKQSEILSVSSDQNYCDLTTIQGSVERIKQPLVNIHRYLGYEQFVRVNRSTIVNIEYISQVDRKKKMCVLKSESYEQSFPVSMRIYLILKIFLSSIFLTIKTENENGFAYPLYSACLGDVDPWFIAWYFKDIVTYIIVAAEVFLHGSSAG
jgi:DNA-binding LytR/AlgR family response regulator